MSPVETTRPATAAALAELTQCQQRLEKTKEDARGERTNHAGAATFWTVIYLVLGLPVIALTAAAGATGVAADNAKLAGWLAFGAAVLSGFIGLLRP